MAADVGARTNNSNNSNKKSPFGQLLEAIIVEYQNVGKWNEDLQRDLPKKWEKHGDLVLLPENSFMSPEWRKLGRHLWETVARCLQVQRVGRKRRIEQDDYRTPHIELLYGQHGWVAHVDNGITYHYDVTKCMFSIGNITEKIRIAKLDCKSQTVVDMFAGIGYFTLPYLVHAKAAYVHACEWNPDAIEALKKNLEENKVADQCSVYEGDCRKVCPVGVADRVNLGLLPSARPYWLTACKALKESGGILHVHENVTSSKLSKPPKYSLRSPSVDVETSQPKLALFAVRSASIDEVAIQNTPVAPIREEISLRTDENCIEGAPHADANANTIRRDSLLEDVDNYEPVISEAFAEQWPLVDRAWCEFSVGAARRIRRFLNNLHDFEWEICILRVGKIKSYAPRIDHIVLDLDCHPVVTEALKE